MVSKNRREDLPGGFYFTKRFARRFCFAEASVALYINTRSCWCSHKAPNIALF
jgi:hypothetical protein